MGNETFQRKRMLYTLRPGNSSSLPLPASSSPTLAAVRRVNKVKQMEKQPQSHAHLVADRLSASASATAFPPLPLPLCLWLSQWFFFANNCSAANNIFVIFCNTRGRRRQGQREGGVASVYFTATFPVAFLLLAQRSVRCTTFSAFVKRIKSMRQQKWKQKRMITGRERKRGGGGTEGDCLSTQEAEELPYTVSASLVSQHG